MEPTVHYPKIVLDLMSFSLKTRKNVGLPTILVKLGNSKLSLVNYVMLKKYSSPLNCSSLPRMP